MPMSSKKGKPISTTPFDLCNDPQNPTFQDAMDGVEKILRGRRNVVVLVGAGMSTSSGIPDFRSSSGLYKNIDIDELGLSCPEDLFDLEFFRENPAPFYKFARHLYFPLGDGIQVKPSDSHKLLALLERENMLLRVYTQNIDGLEVAAGVSEKKVVYAHGSLRWATCSDCNCKVSSESLLPFIAKGRVARCQSPRKPERKHSQSLPKQIPSMPTRTPSQRARKRVRTCFQECDTDDSLCGGVLKPGVTFFGETIDDRVRRFLEADREKADALIVIGTSLSVAPISKVVEFLPTRIPRILINRTIVHPPCCSVAASPNDCDHCNDDFRLGGGYVFDAYLLGFCDEITRLLGRRLFCSKQPRNERGGGSHSTMRSTKQMTFSGSSLEGRLVATLAASDSVFEKEEWLDTGVPADRLLLFPGALPSHTENVGVEYHEVAECDCCSRRIEGVVRKCTICFDFDLCSDCFQKKRRSHYDGKHPFVAERVSRRR